MPYKCSAPGCKGNYNLENKVLVFSFPRDDALKSAWIRAIPRKDFVYTKHSRICERHFTPDNIEWETSASDEKCGRIITVSLNKPRLHADAVPQIFPGCPGYFSNADSSSSRETPDERRLRIEFDHISKAMKENEKAIDFWKWCGAFDAPGFSHPLSCQTLVDVGILQSVVEDSKQCHACKGYVLIMTLTLIPPNICVNLGWACNFCRFQIPHYEESIS